MKISPIASAQKVTLDRERTLILDFNAFAAYQEVMKEELPDVIASLFEQDKKGNLAADKNGTPKVTKSLSSKQVRAAVWAGLLHEDSKLTQNQVGRYLTTKNMQDYVLAIFKSLMGLEEEQEEKDPTLPASETVIDLPNAGTGEKSGLSLVSS